MTRPSLVGGRRPRSTASWVTWTLPPPTYPGGHSMCTLKGTRLGTVSYHLQLQAVERVATPEDERLQPRDEVAPRPCGARRALARAAARRVPPPP
eukprot:scaffold36558_cov85-Phaeocystis_antarctica.AAC.2